MPPRQHHILQAAVRLVDPILRRVYLVLRVWVARERLRIDDLVGEFAPDDEGILE